MLNFKPAFSLSPFTLIKMLFNSSSLPVIKVVSSAYLRLLIFPLAILIPSCDSSSPVFHTKYAAYKLNKKGDIYTVLSFPPNFEPVHCCLLTACRFLRKQVRWCGIPISLRIFQFVVVHTVKDFDIINEAEVDGFLKPLCLCPNKCWQFDLWFFYLWTS